MRRKSEGAPLLGCRRRTVDLYARLFVEVLPRELMTACAAAENREARKQEAGKYPSG